MNLHHAPPPFVVNRIVQQASIAVGHHGIQSVGFEGSSSQVFAFAK